MKIINPAGIIAAACFLLPACNQSDETGVTGDPLTITGPAEKLALLEVDETKPCATFTWNKGIDRAPTDTVTYIFQIGIVGDNFQTASQRDTVANFSKSFTVGELNELVTTQLGVQPGTETLLEARVVANVRSQKFVYPEIAVTQFRVVPFSYRSVPLYLTGSANTEATPVEMPQAVNGRIYKWQGNLKPGGFKFLYDPASELPSLNKGANNNTLVERTDASQPDDMFPISQEGRYAINIDRKNLKITCIYVQYYYEKIYPVGSATTAGWNLGALSVPWNDDNPGVYVFDEPLKEGELKIHTEKSWDSPAFRPMEASGSITSEEVQVMAGMGVTDLKWWVKAEEAGNYRITIDTNVMKIYFVKQ
ncbi:MAG: SusF/SusE family outer membrane protein [Dysgonamonadaceae bacterium]|nr:SusF/SusE family outer membrane protein [Dysgonamonadaceae bacterium]